VRYGRLGHEKPGLIDADGKLRDLSSIIDDIEPAQLSDKSLAKLGRIKHASLPAVRGKPRFGAPVRRAVHKGDDIIPSTKKIGGPGAHITVPITNKDDIWSFDEMDAIDVWIPDAPQAGEIVVSVALAVGGRPFARTRKPS
jgi:hypothetical protein